jgi:hypothetical protein
MWAQRGGMGQLHGLRGLLELLCGAVDGTHRAALVVTHGPQQLHVEAAASCDGVSGCIQQVAIMCSLGLPKT